MSSYKENLDVLFTELREEAFKNLNEEDVDYRTLHKIHVEESHRYNDILNSQSKEDKEFLKEYENDRYALCSTELDYLYFQGYKDCVKFLKTIGIV